MKNEALIHAYLDVMRESGDLSRDPREDLDGIVLFIAEVFVITISDAEAAYRSWLLTQPARKETHQ